jgi:hypothetical protein
MGRIFEIFDPIDNARSDWIIAQERYTGIPMNPPMWRGEFNNRLLTRLLLNFQPRHTELLTGWR